MVEEKMRRKILVSVLIVLLVISISLAQAAEGEDVDLIATVPGYPVADAGGPYSVKVGIELTFDGTGSSDADGTIERFDWDWGVAVPIEVDIGATPTYTYSESGVYTVTLTVTDNEGLTDSDTAKVTVSKPPAPSTGGGGIIAPSNEPPVAEAGPDRAVYVDVAIHFSGAGSYDPDGTIEEYHWFPGDGSYKSGVKVMHVYEESGNYTVSLSVTDNNGATDTDECTVTVHPMPVEPQNQLFETIPANHTSYVVDALDEANTTVTVNTTDTVTVTVIKYESNPYPEDPMPGAGIPKYADIFVSDPDAVDWPIYVEMTYTDEEVEGLDEDSLGIYYWFNGTWQRCSDTGVDTERNVVWAYMTAHEASGSPILMGGIISLEPAEFVVSYLKIEPRRIELGGTVTISVNATNVGETPGSYNVTLNVEEDLIISVKEVTLQGGESEIVEFEFVPEAEGNYDVYIEGMIGTIYVVIPTPLRPAEFVISELEALGRQALVHDDEGRPIVEGEYVIFNVLVENIGETEGTYTVEWKVEGPIPLHLQTIYTLNVTLAAGRGRRAFTYYEALNTGTYQVSVGDLTDTFTVRAPLEPAEFVFSNLQITPRVKIGMSVNISVDVTNVGEMMGFCTFDLKVNGRVVDSVEIPSFVGGVTATQFFELTRGEGTYEVEVGGLTGSFTVFISEPPFWTSPEFVMVVSVIIAAAVILYANWKGMLPFLSPERDTMRSNGNEKGTDWRNKI